MGLCGTCKHWRESSDENEEVFLRYCHVLSSKRNDFNCVTADACAMDDGGRGAKFYCKADFGCVLHEPKGDLS